MPEEFAWESYAHKTGKRVGVVLKDKKYKCSFCGGRGERPIGCQCPVCGGSKTVAIEPPVVVCASCKGRGERYPRSTITCSACKGIGYIKVVEPIEVCPSCRGAGVSGGSKLICFKCKGAGVVTKK